MTSTQGSGFFTSLMALLFLGLIGTAIVGYSMGWLTIEQAPQHTTIQIDTEGIEQAADKAKQEGAELLDQTGESLRESGAALEEAVDQNASND